MTIRIIAAALLAVSVQASAQDDLSSKIVNDPSSPAVNGARASLRDDAEAQGGKALRIQVSKKGENAWDSSVESPLNKPVKAGDELVLAFSARLEKGEAGATSSTIPFAGIQLGSAPYTTIVSQPVDIGPQWKSVEIRGKADKDYAPGTLKVAVHLGTAKQTIDVGPIVVLDMGATP